MYKQLCIIKFAALDSFCGADTIVKNLLVKTDILTNAFKSGEYSVNIRVLFRGKFVNSLYITESIIYYVVVEIRLFTKIFVFMSIIIKCRFQPKSIYTIVKKHFMVVVYGLSYGGDCAT